MPRAMKDSGIEWLGDIPATWKTIKFKYLHNGLNTGEGIDKDYWSTEENDTVFYTAGLAPIKTNYKNFPSWKYTKKNDLLLARNGTPYVYYPVEGACYTDHIIRAEMKETVNKKFIVYSLQQSISSVVVESVSLATWSASLWNEQKIPFPPLDEQQRIAAFLDDKCARIDSVIEKTRASIVEYKRLKQSIITRAVTKGIRPARPMKDSGVEWLGDVPADWEVTKLKYIFSIIGGNGFPDILQGNTTGDYPFCKVSDINSEADYVDTASNWVSQSVVDDNRFNIIPTGSIIMAKIGAALAKNHRKINMVQCCIDNNTQALVPKRKDFLRYLLYLSKCINMSWFDNNSTVPSVNNTKLLNFKVSIPPLDEQKEIAAYLDGKTAAIDSLIKKKGGLVTELESLKKSLIFEYVTGKKEAPT
ncbi:MAG: restriction endonuclease subunit S [Quinella sp. 3Q1]|nr:restriction endonuclease subunit S [Quinella sp. 3Q1]